MPIGKGREVRRFGEIACKNVFIHFAVELLESIRETFIMAAGVGCHGARFRGKK